MLEASYAKKHSINDFGSVSQDKLGILLLRKRNFGLKGFRFKDSDVGDTISVLNLIVDNRIKDAIELASWEWASLPPGRYGQPIKDMKEAIAYYEKYFEEEVCHTSDLKISRSVLSEFLT